MRNAHVKTIAIIQARMAATRLPGKVMKKVCGKPILQHIIERLGRSLTLDRVAVATSRNPEDQAIEDLCRSLGISVFRGSEEDVLGRVSRAAKAFHAGVHVEICGDCPFIDWTIVDQLVEIYRKGEFDHVSNILHRTFPRGLDVQVYAAELLHHLEETRHDPVDREHVSYFIYTHPEKYRLYGMEPLPELRHPEYRWTLDTEEDLAFVRTVYEILYPGKPSFTALDVAELMKEQPDLLAINEHVEQKPVEYSSS